MSLEATTNAIGYVVDYHKGTAPAILVTSGTFNGTNTITVTQGFSDTAPAAASSTFTGGSTTANYSIKNSVISENTTLSISTNLELKYAVEYKTYYTYPYSNTTSLTQVRITGSAPNQYLQLYNVDANANSVSELSQVVEEYNYIKINNNFYKVDTTEDISFDTTTKYYKI